MECLLDAETAREGPPAAGNIRRWGGVAGLVLLLVCGCWLGARWWGEELRAWAWKGMETLQTLAQNRFGAFLAAVVLFDLLNTLLLLPLNAPSQILFAFLIGRKGAAVVLLSLTSLLASVLSQLVLAGAGSAWLGSAAEGFPAVHGQRQTVALALLVRFLYLPLGVKEHMLAALRLPPEAVLGSAAVYFPLHAFLYAMIGCGAASLSELFELRRWSDKTPAERAEFVAFVSLAVLTTALILAVPVVAVRRMQALRVERQGH